MSFSGTKGYITKPKPGVMLNPLHPLSRGLVGCWLFNEGAGSLVNDISGYRNHGTLTNMAPNVQGSGWGSDGLVFDGVDDYVNIPNSSSLDIGTSDLTVVTWFKTDNFIINSRYFSKGGDKRYEITVGTTDFYFTIDDDTTKTDVTISKSGYDDNELHMIVGQRIYGSSTKIKIDDNAWVTTTDNSGDISSALGAQIGTNESYSTPHWDGIIPNVLVYNQALSADEIAWMYREPYAMFEPAFNPSLLYSAAPPVGAIMNQFQRANIGADLYNGVFA